MYIYLYDKLNCFRITTKTSFCWKHFAKINGNSAKCNICGKTIKTAGNTTNMKDHLRNVHKIREEDQTPVSNSGTPRQASIAASFQNITDFGGEDKKQKKINDAIVYMIAKDIQPFSIVENAGFIYLMNTVAPRYEIPSRYKVTKWLDEKYSQMKDLWRTRLTGKSISLTMDIWSDQMSMRSYLGITAHFLLEQEMSSLTIGAMQLSERHTGPYLSEMLEICCSDWNIDKMTLTDNGTNIKKAAEITFGPKIQLPCFAHTINLIARSAIQRESVNGCIAKTKSIVAFFNHSGVASDHLRKATDKVLIQDVPTRWNSTYYMIERFLEVKTQVNDILLSIPNDQMLVTGKEFELLNNVLTMLRPLEEATKIVSGDKYCTASTVIPIVSIIKDKLGKLSDNTQEAKDIKEFLLLEIERRMGSIEQVYFKYS